MELIKIVVAVAIFIFLTAFITYLFNLMGFVFPPLIITLITIVFTILIIRFVIGK